MTRIGYFLSCEDLIKTFRENGGEGKPMQAGYKVCWSTDKAKAVTAAHTIWPTEGLPGELSEQLSRPKHFMQASELVTEEMIEESTVCGDDLEAHVEAFRPYSEAGFDDIHISQIAPTVKAPKPKDSSSSTARKCCPPCVSSRRDDPKPTSRFLGNQPGRDLRVGSYAK
jgi:hypothetical protein